MTTPGPRAPVIGSWVPSDADLRAYALHAGVCVRPLMRRVTDTTTGDTHTIAIRCGSTRDHVCPPCAARARALRAQQCAEGWHLSDDPLPQDDQPETAEEGDADTEPQGEALPVSHDRDSRRTRSTRRRDDAPDLPRVPTEDRTVGREFTGRDGRTYRPSMFVTLTLPSYGRVTRDTGTPVDPGSYDYTRAARDAVALSALVDRWRCGRVCTRRS